MYPKLEDYPSTDYFCVHTLGGDLKVSIDKQVSGTGTDYALSYSFDKVIWNAYTFGTTLTVQNHVYFKATSTNPFTLTSYCHLNADKLCAISGKISTLFNNDISITSLDLGNYSSPLFSRLAFTDISTYNGLFDGGSITSTNGFFNSNTNIKFTEYLQINIKDLYYGCFNKAFAGCTNLYNTPALPWTTLAERCYEEMFLDCNNLNVAPTLAATTLQPYCYAGMFGWCYNLQNAPVLPATTLAEGCYTAMFQMFKIIGTDPYTLPEVKLMALPKLPATTLAEKCYLGMFGRCAEPGSNRFILPTVGTITDSAVIQNPEKYTRGMISWIDDQNNLKVHEVFAPNTVYNMSLQTVE